MTTESGTTDLEPFTGTTIGLEPFTGTTIGLEPFNGTTVDLEPFTETTVAHTGKTVDLVAFNEGSPYSWITLPALVFLVWVIVRLLRNRSLGTALKKAPGSFLLSLTDFLYSRKDQERVFIPIIGDMREEYFEAYQKKRYMKARWIRIRYSWAFVQAMGIKVGVSLIRKIIDAWYTGH